MATDNSAGPHYVRFDETLDTPQTSRADDGSARSSSFCVKQKGACGGPGVWGIRRKVDRCGMAMLILGVLLLISASTAPLLVDNLIRWGIDQQTIINGPKGQAYQTFVESGANLGVKIGFSVSWLNLTNPNEVLQGEIPLLEEKGPYIYQEYRKKLNITFSADGDQVAFVLRKYYLWDEEANQRSGLSDTEDMITSVHPVIQILQLQLQSVLSLPMQELLVADTTGLDASVKVR